MFNDHGKLRVLFEMAGFRGWRVSALWDDLKFDVKHFSDIERLATVGDKQWEKGMTAFCKPFTKAKIHYFDRSTTGEAHTGSRENQLGVGSVVLRQAKRKPRIQVR